MYTAEKLSQIAKHAKIFVVNAKRWGYDKPYFKVHIHHKGTPSINFRCFLPEDNLSDLLISYENRVSLCKNSFGRWWFEFHLWKKEYYKQYGRLSVFSEQPKKNS